MFQASALASMRMPNMSCHAEEVLEASRALQVMRGREQLLRFARPRLPIQNPADVHQLFSWAPFKRRQPEKDEKGSQKFQKKNSCRLHANCSNSVLLSFAVQPPTICEQNDKNVLIHVDGEVPLRASRSVVVFSGLRILRITHFIARFTRFSCASLHFLLFLLCFVTCFLW